MKFLHHIVKLNKSLAAKKDKVTMLRYHFDNHVNYAENPTPTKELKFQPHFRDLNSEAEKTKSFGEVISEDFQRR